MKKILFNDKYLLTQAVLDGTKTMTRRILHGTLFWERCSEGMWTDDEIKAWKKEVDQRLIDYSMTDEWLQMKIFAMKHCRYKVGEVVAIAQSYNTIGKTQYDKFGKGVPGNRNKMFTRAELLPHHIQITGVKIERLQSISDADILKEGVWQFYDNKNLFYVSKNIGYAPDVAFLSAREAFWYLIDHISGKGTWESNPWVVAYSFELVD